MDNTENVIRDFWRYLEEEDTKISNRVLDYLNRDELAAIIINDVYNPSTYWLEFHGDFWTPKYVFNYIKRWMNRRDVEYLYDKYPG